MALLADLHLHPVSDDRPDGGGHQRQQGHGVRSKLFNETLLGYNPLNPSITSISLKGESSAVSQSANARDAFHTHHVPLRECAVSLAC